MLFFQFYSCLPDAMTISIWKTNMGKHCAFRGKIRYKLEVPMNGDDNNSNNSKIRNIMPSLFTRNSFLLQAPLSLISSMRVKALCLVDNCYTPSIQPIAQNTVDNQYVFVE